MLDDDGISVIIPVFNEEKTISGVINQLYETLKAYGSKFEILVINDASTDSTKEICDNIDFATLVNSKFNKGYGSSIKKGLIVSEFNKIVIIDGDGTYPVSAIPDLLDRLDDSDMVVGSRTGNQVSIPLVRRPAKWFLRKLSEYVTGQKIDDINSGLRCFRKDLAMQYYSILPDKFSLTTTITVASLSDGHDVEYVKINYSDRKGQSKIVPWDFFNFTALTIRLCLLFKPLKIFFPLGLSIFILGLIKLSLDVLFSYEEIGALNIEFLKNRTVSTTSLILFLSSLQIILFGMVAEAIVRKISLKKE